MTVLSEIDWDRFRVGTIVRVGIAGPYVILDMGFQESGEIEFSLRHTPRRTLLLRTNIELAMVPSPWGISKADWTLPADPLKVFHFEDRAYTVRGFSGPPGSGGTIRVDIARVPQLDGSDEDGNVPEMVLAVRKFRQSLTSSQ